MNGFLQENPRSPMLQRRLAFPGHGSRAGRSTASFVWDRLNQDLFRAGSKDVRSQALRIIDQSAVELLALLPAGEEAPRLASLTATTLAEALPSRGHGFHWPWPRRPALRIVDCQGVPGDFCPGLGPGPLGGLVLVTGCLDGDLVFFLWNPLSMAVRYLCPGPPELSESLAVGLAAFPLDDQHALWRLMVVSQSGSSLFTASLRPDDMDGDEGQQWVHHQMACQNGLEPLVRMERLSHEAVVLACACQAGGQVIWQYDGLQDRLTRLVDVSLVLGTPLVGLEAAWAPDTAALDLAAVHEDGAVELLRLCIGPGGPSIGQQRIITRRRASVGPPRVAFLRDDSHPVLNGHRLVVSLHPAEDSLHLEATIVAEESTERVLVQSIEGWAGAIHVSGGASKTARLPGGM